MQSPKDIFNAHAQAYEQRFMDVSLYSENLDSFLSLLKKNAAVLEIACGPGNITKYLLDKSPELRILGTDIAENMIELAKKNNPAADFFVMDCHDIISINKKFDAVVCGFCLPYLDPGKTQKLVADCASLLHEDGFFYLSTMEEDAQNKTGAKTNSYGEETQMHFYTQAFIERTLNENNFLLLSLEKKTEQGGRDSATDLHVIAQKR